MKQYHDLVRHVLEHGTRKPNRTGVDTISTFNVNYEVDLADGFPLLTTKAMSWKNIVIENLWFLSGARDIAFLRKHGCKFWDAWADDAGRVPSAYGNLWRRFPVHGYRDSSDMWIDGDLCCAYNDQIRWVIDELKRNPMSRRLVVSAWAPGNAQTSALPPCHAMFVLNVQVAPSGEQILNLHLTQRSADIALGVPYNIAGYSLLLHLFARVTGLEPGVFAHSIVDAHIYTAKIDGSDAEHDHVPGLREQLTREPRRLPRLVIDPAIQSLTDVEALLGEDTETIMRAFRLEGYDPHPAITFKVAV